MIALILFSFISVHSSTSCRFMTTQNQDNSTPAFNSEAPLPKENFNRWARAVRQQMLEALRKREQQ